MREEMEAIEKNSTWDLVKPHEKCKPIGVKWIYKVKRNSTGEIKRHKARLVAKGYSKKKVKIMMKYSLRLQEQNPSKFS